MKKLFTTLCLVASMVAFAEVKPSTEPWLKSGEKLACFGDSLTGPNGYMKHLTAKLNAKGIEVINAGLSGDKTPMALTRIKTDVADKNPDALMIFFGTNDSVIGKGRWSDEPVVSPITFRDNLLWIIHYCLLKTNIRKFAIVTLAGNEGKAATEYGNTRDEYLIMAREAVDMANKLLKIRGENAPYVILVPMDTEMDAIRATMQPNEKGYKLTSDGTHMSAKGYELMANIMLKYFNLAD